MRAMAYARAFDVIQAEQANERHGILVKAVVESAGGRLLG